MNDDIFRKLKVPYKLYKITERSQAIIGLRTFARVGGGYSESTFTQLGVSRATLDELVRDKLLEHFIGHNGVDAWRLTDAGRRWTHDEDE